MCLHINVVCWFFDVSVESRGSVPSGKGATRHPGSVGIALFCILGWIAQENACLSGLSEEKLTALSPDCGRYDPIACRVHQGIVVHYILAETAMKERENFEELIAQALAKTHHRDKKRKAISR